MKHTLFLAGATVDLSLPQTDILATINDPLGKCYPGNLVVATEYKELDERTCEITITRNLPFNYANGLGGNCINYIDESILSGMPEIYFQYDVTGKTTPLVMPLLPMYGCWYSPIVAFNSFFRSLHETMTTEKLSRVKIKIRTDTVIITIKYPRTKGKYDDDVRDLEVELGDSLESHRGETLSYRLFELGQICERTQIKAKSYMGLKSYLKRTYDITLNILK